jgi:hypothetical protein
MFLFQMKLPKGYQKLPFKLCKMCGKKLRMVRHLNRKYCSMPCAQRYWKITKRYEAWIASQKSPSPEIQQNEKARYCA